MTKTIPLIVLPLALVAGCVVYDEQLVYDDPSVQGHEDLGDTGVLPEDIEPSSLAFVSPSTGELGATLITSLQGDFEPSEVTNVRFIGAAPIIVADTITRDDELLLAVQLGALACDGTVLGAPGPGDLLVEMIDGTAIYVPGAFEVLSQ